MKFDTRDIAQGGHEASDAIGTLHVAHFVPFGKEQLAFFTVSSHGDMEKYFQDFAEKTSFVFDSIFPHVEGAPPTPVAKNAEAFYQWGLDYNYPAIGFYSGYPGLSSSRIFVRFLPIASRNLPPEPLGLTWSRIRTELELDVCPGKLRPRSTGDEGPGDFFTDCVAWWAGSPGRYRRLQMLGQKRRSTSLTFKGSVSVPTQCR